MVECGGLENRLGRKLYVGSNPTPSADSFEKTTRRADARARVAHAVPAFRTRSHSAARVFGNVPRRLCVRLWIGSRTVDFALRVNQGLRQCDDKCSDPPYS